MSSKIKVDTIENVAGSGNVSLGSGHNLVVPGNQTVGGTLGVTGTMAGASTLSLNGVSAQTTYAIQTQTKPVYLSSTDTTYADVTLKKGAATTVDYLQLRDDSNNLDLKIDSVGRFIADRQPSFCARMNSYPAMDIATAPFETVLHNIGNHYSNSTYRFTAPVTGRYYLSYSVRVNHGTSGHIIHPVFFINGNSDTTSRTIYRNDTGGAYMATTFSYIRQLSANDYVTVNMSSSSSGGTMQTGQCSFTGHLLG